MLNRIGDLFEPVTPSQNYARRDVLILLSILAAGAWLRFWQLGNVGLHGDEDIMALAARGIVEYGVPRLPGDMLYLRAPLHTYLLAGTTLLFGDTEWALRLPSAIVGCASVLLAFFLGRRFLEPKGNLVFVALVAVLPAMIEISQTARMYVFFVACVMAVGILVFRWEHYGGVREWLLAMFVLIVAIQLHRLAVFAAPILLYPGLANRSRRQLALGCVGVIAALIASEVTGQVSNLDYPDEAERLDMEDDEATRLSAAALLAENLRVITLVTTSVVILATVAIFGLRTTRSQCWGVAVTLVTLGMIACVWMQYHAGLTLLLAGGVLWFRTQPQSRRRLLLILPLIALVATLQYFAIEVGARYEGRSIIGAYVGWPSVWPAIQFSQFSPAASLLVAISAAAATLRLATGSRIPIHFLFFMLAVWAPLFAIGLFSWHPAARYTIGPLPFLMLAAVAGLAYLLQLVRLPAWQSGRPLASAVLSAAVVAVVGNPVLAWRVAQNDYTRHPDHKGAAEFVLDHSRGSRPVVIAEDSIVQTYYLGHVDYRLQSVFGAKSHGLLKDGVLYDQYTGAEVIGSGDEFSHVLNERAREDIYVISSAQVSDSLKRRNRGNGISEVLASGRFEEIYVGRDGATVVWKLAR